MPDPGQASSVLVSFASDGPERTLVVLVHDGFDRHGADAAGYRDAMASPHGWPLILERFMDTSKS